MKKTLLEKTRIVNKLIQRKGEPVKCMDVAKVLGQVLTANIYIVGRRGKILGYSFMNDFTCETLEDIVNRSKRFPQSYIEGLMKIDETITNIAQVDHGCIFNSEQLCRFRNKLTTVVPILGGGERVGTLVLAKYDEEFQEDDLVLAEYGATVVGMEILQMKVERAEEEARKKVAVQIAVGTLSYSEHEAVEHIFAELGGEEGLLVASKIADRVGITRSVIVNALRKFESAGVIESKSLGMKGTYIRILNDYLMDELDKSIKHAR
ncbi:MAG: GTP-sensing pleiotropic transcriptional regulator CodY [Desulfosporosinus sp.]|jgi:transcriptional pleiotropic repressor